MKRSKNAGFTLIELAIVLVVIGLIIAAVLKGEDLIQNARMLNFVTNPVQKAQVAAMAYYDRTGQFPAMTGSTTNDSKPLLEMYNAGIDGVLDLNNPFTKGSTQLGIVFSSIKDSTSGATYPVIVITPVTVSGTTVSASTWTPSAIGYANYLKSKIDGNSSSWSTGSVRFINTTPTFTFTLLSNEITGVTTNTYDGYVTSALSAALTNSSTYTTPTANTTTGTLLYFYNQQPH
ncbi:prepilin-type N-terminal cleavage/methylation domain-containing protein [Desulfurella multipotens]|uniref:Prepilin-type N-terminal cleavage/methylation domain-containing protein n=1 Tax=Desulfurella multipotens TaxID=79269 RepID=A0A1G6NTP9_9BACT|nr:prepilin-type N-terminal cleavage/methylation domain-containing protein [Desulfurella multipotens]SDC70981.1 prepilin-type N-terminal cleavage/methylation domain-containing protein [Desulfurella multipotens]